ncbi:hypothetical protein KZO25_08835 [Halomonas sp. ANAO-440]|uniref:hypothetical protein n=1 Tax=Halomonas sp. ANAO-440 TaxID=2861360 RepID=UPI001CAA4E45|nr:hypothetical protein [Halomonas sp. ANAO-440]MBZ0330422.1 hypothetical protein [Halomonas sp. ANAO-440]
MKHLIATLTLAAGLAGTAQADTKSQLCDILYAISEDIMFIRQNNAPMPEAMRIVAGEPVLEAVVRDAYSRPLFSTSKHQQRTIREFANDNYRRCIEQD